MKLKKRVVFEKSPTPMILFYGCRIVDDSEKELLTWDFQSINSDLEVSKQLEALEENSKTPEFQKLYDIGSKWLDQYLLEKATAREMCTSANEFYCRDEKILTNKMPKIISKLLDREDWEEQYLEDKNNF